MQVIRKKKPFRTSSGMTFIAVKYGTEFGEEEPSASYCSAIEKSVDEWIKKELDKDDSIEYINENLK
tara:strand:- start:69 stop:269 length:201 start_codon:yes stop_codon:yes gene_type:complete